MSFIFSDDENSSATSKYSENTFESIKHIDETGNEYWNARELQRALEYTEWRNFKKVIKKAMDACKGSNIEASEHFVEVNKMFPLGNGAIRKSTDYKLSRYACYLIVMNGDPAKEVIALGQTYFLDNMDYEELAANLFRATQAESKLRRDNIKSKNDANETHYIVGKKVRQTIAELGGTMPEKLPKPEKNIKQLEKEQKMGLKNKRK